MSCRGNSKMEWEVEYEKREKRKNRIFWTLMFALFGGCAAISIPAGIIMREVQKTVTLSNGQELLIVLGILFLGLVYFLGWYKVWEHYFPYKYYH